MSDKPKLSDQQLLFVKEYCVDQNATQAAIRAGYSKKTARQIGAKQCTKVVIKAEIAKQMQKHHKKIDDSAEQVLRDLKEISDYGKEKDNGKMKDAGNAVRASELRGKYYSLFTDKTELTGKDGQPINITISLRKDDEEAND